MTPMCDKLNAIRKKENQIKKFINDSMKEHFTKYHGDKLKSENKMFLVYNQLTSHLYYAATTKYLKAFVGKFFN